MQTAPQGSSKSSTGSIVGLALYGSRARQDHDPDADFDLFAVTTGPRHATARGHRFTISCYPLDRILHHARIGDLFALHIASEAKVIYEAEPVFEQIARAFTYRADYSREIRLASDVGWFLVRYGHRFRHRKVLNQKIAWCTRTMLIAKAASRRMPIFSAQGLYEFSSSPDVLALIKNKDSSEFNAEMVERFRAVLRSFGAQEPPVPQSLNEQERIFEEDRNIAGLSALHALMK